MISLTKNASFDRKPALATGIGLIIMAIAAGFSYGFVHGELSDLNNPTTIFNNISASSLLFNAGIFGWLVVLACDIIVTWGLYLVLKPINGNLSLLSALFRLTYATLLGIAILNLVFISVLSSGIDYVSLIGEHQLAGFTLLFLEAFEMFWYIGLVIFGGHLILVGYLTWQTKYIPKIISILVMLGGIGYLILHLGWVFLPQLDDLLEILNYIFILPMTLGEFGLGVWLIWLGVKKINK